MVDYVYAKEYITFPKEWKIIFMKLKGKNTNQKLEEQLPFNGMTNETLLMTISKCVDYDFFHDSFLEYCLLLSGHMIETFKCHSETTMECILSTYYMAKRFPFYKKQQDYIKQNEHSFSGPLEVLFKSSFNWNDEQMTNDL